MKRLTPHRIGQWEVLRFLAALLVAVSFCLAIHAEAASEARDATTRLWVAAASDDIFLAGGRVLGWSLLASEGILLVAALAALRSREVSVPRGLPLRGRWLLWSLRAFTWVGPGAAAGVACGLAGRDPVRALVILVPAGVIACVLLLTPVYIVLGLRELASLSEGAIQAAQSKPE